jgi:pimeloyl-ACP methyl ester carboxylesterase
VAAFEDKIWWSDNLRLHFRDYAGRDDRPPIICIPGLTRNARDFEGLAERLAGRWRVICVDLRGRAESAYAKDPMSYAPLIYLRDLERLFMQEGIDRFVGIGTSLGGLMLMLIAAADKGRLAGALINDVGPKMEEEGLERIRAHVGNGTAFPTWVHAARHMADIDGALYPDYRLEDWIAFAKRRYRLNSKGRIVLDYDQKIAEPFRVPGNEAGFDLWPAYEALGECPVTIVRGGLSDFLSEETAQEMVRRVPDVEFVTVPRIGHAPTLMEPEALAAIDRLLERVLVKQPA